MRSAFVKIPEQNHQTRLNPRGDARREQGEKVKGDRVTGMFVSVLVLFPYLDFLSTMRNSHIHGINSSLPVTQHDCCLTSSVGSLSFCSEALFSYKLSLSQF